MKKSKFKGKKEIKKITLGGLLLVIGFLVGWRMMPHTKVTNNTIYKEPEKVIKVELPDGWLCDKPKMTTDLLQPSGYLIGDTIDCWKLETPIDEYKIQMCEETGDDYFCKNL